MKITKIEQQKKSKTSRYNLYCDDLFVCGVSERTIAQYFLYEGKEISKELLEEIIEKDKLNYGMTYAYSLISYSPRTSYELEKKLLQKGVSKEHCEIILNKLKENNYINDKSYAKSYIQNCILKKYGKNKMKQGLIQKGFDSKIAIEYVENFFHDLECNNTTNYSEKNYFFDNDTYEISILSQIENNIKELVLKKAKLVNYSNEDDSLTKRKKKEKIIRYLLSKGYEYEEILKQISCLDYN